MAQTPFVRASSFWSSWTTFDFQSSKAYGLHKQYNYTQEKNTQTHTHKNPDPPPSFERGTCPPPGRLYSSSMYLPH